MAEILHSELIFQLLSKSVWSRLKSIWRRFKSKSGQIAIGRMTPMSIVSRNTDTEQSGM